MATHPDLSAALPLFDATCPHGWANGLSREEIGFLQLFDDQWLDLGREKVMSVLKAAYILVGHLSQGPQLRIVHNAMISAGGG
jgi:hypothetical protein